MFSRKAVLPVDFNTEVKDVEMVLDDSNKAENKSTNGAVYTKLLKVVKANIVKALRKQKAYYDKRHYIKGSYTYLCTYTGRHVIYMLTYK